MLKRVAALVLATLIGGCAGSQTRPGTPEAALVEASDRQILVMISDPEFGRLDLRGARSGPYRLSRGYSGRSPHVLRVLAELAAEYPLQLIDGWAMQSLDVHCAVFEVGPEMSVDELIAALASDARVESVQRMQKFELKAYQGTSRANDPYRRLQHALEDLRLADAHRWATGRGVRVAVIDTAVDVRHPELVGQVAELKDFVDGGAPAAGDRHGTAVAGVIASLAGNSRGIVGVSPGARLLALKACEQRHADGNGICTSFSLARAIDFAINADSDVLNLSLGGPPDRLLERLLVEAIKRNIVVIAALGASGGRGGFPASMDGVIAVGDEYSPSDAKCLKAPGLNVLTLVPSDGYDFLSGNSLAAAHVSGIVALLLESSPALRATAIERLLTRTSQRIQRADNAPGVMVSACAALAELAGEAVCGGDAGLTRAAGNGRRNPS
jgi:subtilisin family serine protease